MSVNGAFEAPAPEPDGWLVLGADDQAASLEMLRAADALMRHAGNLVVTGCGE